MPQFKHLKDKFGNDMFFGDADDIRFPAMPNVADYSKQLQRVRDVRFRPDDVLITGYPKSGNNWTHHMVNMLVQGTTKVPPVTDSNFHFIDTIGGNIKISSPDKPRVFLSHLPFRFLPRDVAEKKVKVVYVTRNPKDVFVSLFCHITNVKVPLGYEGTWSQFFEVMLDQGFWYGSIFDHLRDWEKEIKAHPDHPIFHCSYEESKENTMKQVEKLNEFLGTGRGRQLMEEIVNTCQVGNMHKTRRHEFKGEDPFSWKCGSSHTDFYRKGMVGDWKNWFTVAQNKVFDDVYTTKMADSKRTFVFE